MPERSHIVRRGDTLWGISRHYRVEMSLLAEINGLRGRQQHALQIGQQIRLPDAAQAEADTVLSLRILDLAFRPINRAKLKLEYDDKVIEVVGNGEGEVGPVMIDDHAKGLKVHFRELDGEYVLIADHKILPLGRKRLTLTSRKMLVRGNYLHQEGSQRQAAGDVRREVKRGNDGHHIEPTQGKGGSTTTVSRNPPVAAGGGRAAPPKPQPSAGTADGPGLVDRMGQLAEDAWGWLTGGEEEKAPAKPPAKGLPKSTGTPAQPAQPLPAPQPVSKQTRVEGGRPAHVVGALFAEENLKLLPANEKYRKIIIGVAKRHGMTPQALAAVINAEAAKDYKTGEWKADSKASTSSASGLTQFLDDTFLELATDKRSMVNQMLKRKHGYEQVNSRYRTNAEGERVLDYIYGKTGEKKHRIDEDDVLPLRFDPEYSIDAGAVYAIKNLDTMSRMGVDSRSLPSEDLAKLMYMAHHEGAGGAIKVIKGTLTEDRAKVLLPAQMPGEKKRKALLERFGGNYKKAYIHWLYSYTDSMINVLDFMVKPGDYQPRSMAEIAVIVNGEAAAKPAPKPAGQSAAKPASPPSAAPKPAAPVPASGSQSTSIVGGVVAATGWRNPLDVNIIRSAKLASWKGATFGMVRSNGARAHQGIDLVAVPGTPVYAVANGKVVSVYRGFHDQTGFGATVVLCVDVNDLPEPQRKFYLGKRPDDKVVYFAYCHLGRIDVTLDKDGTLAVEIGTRLGQTGESGNAIGMNTVTKGAHLHFEARYQHPLPAGRTGLKYRVDPRPFLVGVPNPT